MRAEPCLLISLAIILLLPLSGRAQNDSARKQEGLTLHGFVTSLAVEEGRGSHYVRVGLRHELTNTGPIPIILWNHEGRPGGLWREPFAVIGKVISRTPDFKRADVLDASWGGPSRSTGPQWAEMRGALDRPTPPPGLTKVLLPNQSLVFNSAVTIVGSEMRTDSFPERPTFAELKEANSLWLRVYYEAWSFNLEPNTPKGGEMNFGFGRRLQRRWEGVGKLWLDLIYSEPIRIDLSAATRKTPEQ